MPNTLLDTLRSILGAAIYFNPQGYLSAFFFVLWLFYCLQINTAYQSSLMGFLTNPGNLPAVTTLEELDNSGLDLYILEGTRHNYENFDVMERILKKKIKTVSKIPTDYHQFTETGGDFAVLSYRSAILFNFSQRNVFLQGRPCLFL